MPAALTLLTLRYTRPKLASATPTSPLTCTTRPLCWPVGSAWNHPLPDGNKRAAWTCLVLFIDLNGGSWNDGRPDPNDAVEAMLAVAAHDVDETWLAAWLKDRVDLQA